MSQRVPCQECHANRARLLQLRTHRRVPGALNRVQPLSQQPEVRAIAGHGHIESDRPPQPLRRSIYGGVTLPLDRMVGPRT